jgi:nitroreductase
MVSTGRRALSMFISLARNRRSIRKFLNKKVESEKVGLMIEAALRSPSSMGHSPWEFIVVEDTDILKGLSEAKIHGSGFLKDAPLAVVVCADPKSSDVWIEDASIASTFIFMQAESLGLGACWIQIRDRDHGNGITSETFIVNLLNLPEHLKVLSIIALGYPDEKKAPHQKETLKYNKVFLNTYENSYGYPTLLQNEKST